MNLLMTRIKEIEEILFKDKKITREKLCTIYPNRQATSAINTLKNRGYTFDIEYDITTWIPLVYNLKEYKKPFYIIMRHIEHDYPELEKKIREEFKELEEKDTWILDKFIWLIK